MAQEKESIESRYKAAIERAAVEFNLPHVLVSELVNRVDDLFWESMKDWQPD